MTKRTRSHGEDLRGASRLAVEATRAVTEIVKSMHQTIASGPAILGKPLEKPVRLVTDIVYGNITGVTKLVGAGIDLALAQLAPLLGEGAPGPERDAVLAALNGVLGDYLAETDNPLAIEMTLRHGEHALTLEPAALREAIPDASGTLLVLVHGSCMSDRQWLRNGHDHGAALARDLGVTPVYVHYNSGLHVSTNGRALADRLERLVAAWPREEPPRIILLGHSMGGLVLRSACAAAEATGHAWCEHAAALVCLGSPHHGAPLERGGHWANLLLGISRYSAPLTKLGEIRSAGITDLRYGNVLDEHWADRDRFDHGGDPRARLDLPRGVACYAIAGSIAEGTQLGGDGMVPVDSALGRHPRPELALAFPEDHTWIAKGVGHLDLLDRPEVYAKIVSWLS